jgi:hypothetical protein
MVLGKVATWGAHSHVSGYKQRLLSSDILTGKDSRPAVFGNCLDVDVANDCSVCSHELLKKLYGNGGHIGSVFRISSKVTHICNKGSERLLYAYMPREDNVMHFNWNAVECFFYRNSRYNARRPASSAINNSVAGSCALVLVLCCFEWLSMEELGACLDLGVSNKWTKNKRKKKKSIDLWSLPDVNVNSRWA